MRVAILDDDVAWANTLKSIVYEYFDAHGEELEQVALYHDGTSLLTENHKVDLLFLDIEVGTENGIEIAKELRRSYPDLIIIVLTSFMQYSMDGYKIQAARYLLKPVPKDLLFSELDEILAGSAFDQWLLLEGKEDLIRLRLKDVTSIESYGRKSKVYARSEEWVDQRGINEWKAELQGHGFFECYKGILAALRHIKVIQKDMILLEDGRMLPLARRRAEECRALWIQMQGTLL